MNAWFFLEKEGYRGVAMMKNTNSKIQIKLLIKFLLISPLKLLSYIASFYASLLENVKVGLGDYWLECEAEKNRLRKQTISHLQNGRKVKLTLFTPNFNFEELYQSSNLRRDSVNNFIFGTRKENHQKTKNNNSSEHNKNY